MRFGTPVTPSSRSRRTPASTPGGASRGREERILVTVRVRPLSSKEQAAYDLIAWEFPDERTIKSKNLSHDRPCGLYTFDKVFDFSCSGQRVYEQGARDVALSVLSGINATIFAYGQTSSGKTYTMRGITENVIMDIYKHIAITQEREFVLKFSALEIYNETVVDLLNRDSAGLRLLDDPERGTIVEKQAEEAVKDAQHLWHLIHVCEAQRQIGETDLNDKSSRSHQIIKLTVESSLRENTGSLKSLLASLYLVDLAGSERVTQTNADGTRLKEGSHINRSLLTLTTVIRKLSGGKRSNHIPYRDSKLTRILQSSLGGNARTAIICTMSPALSHVEQSRNTLNFATSAKEVTNNAQVNLVVAEKQLLKYLQKQVARLEAERQSPEPFGSSTLRSLLLEKDMKIQKMEIEMNELKRQRDIAESQLQLERSTRKEPKGSNSYGPSHQLVKCLSFTGEDETVSDRPLSRTRQKKLSGRQSASQSILVSEIRKVEMRQKQLGNEANRALELLHKEVAAHRLGSQDATESIAKLLLEIKDMQAFSCIPENIDLKDKASLKEEIARLATEDSNIASLREKLETVQRSIDNLVMSCPSGGEQTPDSRTSLRKKKVQPFSLSNAANMPNIIRSPCSPGKMVGTGSENKSPETPVVTKESSTPHAYTPLSKHPKSVDLKKMERMFKKGFEEQYRGVKAYVTELKERCAKLQYQKQLLVCEVLQMETNNSTADESDGTEPSHSQSPMSWQLVFEDQRMQIIMLWHLCHVSIVHRTQFYLLFNGDPSEQIYMEVELRRLTWLEQHLADLGNASPALLGDDAASFVVSSVRELKQERENLARRISTKLNAEEREYLYMKWGIPPEGKGKPKRRLQLANKLWTDPLDMEHVKESAEIVAKLVGFCESGENASKEMFALNFVSPCDKKSWPGWNLISNLLHL